MGRPLKGRNIRRHFAEATFSSTLLYKPVSELVFKSVLCFENQFENRFQLSETGLYQKVLEKVVRNFKFGCER